MIIINMIKKEEQRDSDNMMSDQVPVDRVRISFSLWFRFGNSLYENSILENPVLISGKDSDIYRKILYLLPFRQKLKSRQIIYLRMF